MTNFGVDSTARWLLPAVLFVLLLPLYLGLLPWAFDDAYIHLRMAGNLAAGQGPSVNPGQPVNAGSAPAWTLLVALSAWVGLSAPFWVGVFNAMATALGAGLFVELADKLGARSLGPGSRVLLAGTYCGVLHYSGAGLMETPLALLCLCLGLLAWTGNRPVAAGLVIVACFLRLELAAFAGPVLIDGLISRRWPRLRTLTWAAGCGAPFLLYEFYFFGSAIPHTALAKAVVYDLSFSDALGVLAVFAMPSTAPFDLAAVRILCGVGLFSALIIGVAGGRARERVSSWDPLAVLAVGTLTIPAVYLVTRTLVFPWYPPLFVVPALLVLFSVARRSARAWPVFVVALCGLLPYAVDLAPSVRAVVSGKPQGYRYFAVNARVRSYLELGRQLGNAYPGLRLLSSEVGGLGYAYEGEIVDGMGLVSPRALEFHPMKVPEQRRSGLFGAIPAAFVELERPELIVSMDPFIEEFVRSPISKAYRRYRFPLYLAEDTLPGTTPMLWGTTSMSVFVRNDLPLRWPAVRD